MSESNEPSDLAGQLYSLLSLVEEANKLAAALDQEIGEVFGVASLMPLRLDPAELGFHKVTAWLYVLYFEVGRSATKFLVRKCDLFLPGGARDSNDHRELISQLRTYLQHNLDRAKPRDATIRRKCEKWFQENCGTSIPAKESEWHACLGALVAAAADFLAALITVLRTIEKDPNHHLIIEAWRAVKLRYHLPHEFDQLIEIVASEIGRDHLDSVTFRTRYYTEWTQELALLQDGYDFVTEARKLIERELLKSRPPTLPITGSDIMRELDIEPGPRVGELLQMARSIYEAQPCSSDDLLAQLREELGLAPSGLHRAATDESSTLIHPGSREP